MGGGLELCENLCVGSCICLCVFAPMYVQSEGRPAGSVVVGEGEEPPDGQLWQRGQLWSRAQEEEEEGRESSRPSRRGKRWSRAAEWGTRDDGVLKPMVGPSNSQEKTPASLLHNRSDSLEYTPLAVLKYYKCLWKLVLQNSAKRVLKVIFLSKLISFCKI